MKRTLAGVALVAAVLAALSLSTGGKQVRGRFGLAPATATLSAR